MTLAEAIEQQINLGTKDPAQVAVKLVSLYGRDWLAEQLLAEADSIIAELARQQLGGRRRGAEVALERRQTRWQRAGGELMLESKWVSAEVGWKRIGDLTAEDCRTIARNYGTLAIAMMRRRDWFETAAALIKEQGVKTLAQVRELPALPAAEAA